MNSEPQGKPVEWIDSGVGGPKEIVVCLACGDFHLTDFQLRDGSGCEPNDEDSRHGPTQKVLVLPLNAITGLVEALEAVAALADRLKAQGKLDPEEGICGDPDLAFPCDVELSVADLERAMSALAEYRETAGGSE